MIKTDTLIATFDYCLFQIWPWQLGAGNANPNFFALLCLHVEYELQLAEEMLL